MRVTVTRVRQSIRLARVFMTVSRGFEHPSRVGSTRGANSFVVRSSSIVSPGRASRPKSAGVASRGVEIPVRGVARETVEIPVLETVEIPVVVLGGPIFRATVAAAARHRLEHASVGFASSVRPSRTRPRRYRRVGRVRTGTIRVVVGGGGGLSPSNPPRSFRFTSRAHVVAATRRSISRTNDANISSPRRHNKGVDARDIPPKSKPASAASSSASELASSAASASLASSFSSFGFRARPPPRVSRRPLAPRLGCAPETAREREDEGARDDATSSRATATTSRATATTSRAKATSSRATGEGHLFSTSKSPSRARAASGAGANLARASRTRKHIPGDASTTSSGNTGSVVSRSIRT